MKSIFIIVLLTTTFLYSNKLSELYFKKACNKNIAQGCYNLGLAHLKKKPLKIDNLKAIIALDKACKLHLGNACYKLATMYESGKNARRSKIKAKLYYKRACINRHRLSCQKYIRLK
jgi:TPR repeat protein